MAGSNIYESILNLLLVDLGKTSASPEAQQGFLQQLIRTAEKEIQRKGITLNYSEPDHMMLVSRYAAYLYRKRIVSGPDSYMPRSLRLAMNEMLFSQKGKADA